MRLLRKHRANLSRHIEGYWDKGEYSERREDSEITCLVQPTFSRSLYQKVQASGIHLKDCREIYTHHQLLTGDDNTQVKSDYITFEGVQYEVYENNIWDSFTERLSHYRAVMIKRDKIHGSSKS